MNDIKEVWYYGGLGDAVSSKVVRIGDKIYFYEHKTK